MVFQIDPLFHVKDLEFGEVREVCDVVDAVASSIQFWVRL